MGLLIIRLITFLNSQSPDSTYYHVAVTMLENYSRIHLISIEEIAKLCHVSKSTISKFTRQLGFDDYLDLKDNAAFVENRFNNPLNYVSNILTSIESDGVNDYLDAVCEDVNYLREHMDLSAIDHVAKAISDYDNVAAFGLMFSESAALDLQCKLAYNGKFIRSFQDDVLQEAFLKKAKADTLILILTNSGEYLTKQQIKLGTPKKNVFSSTQAKIAVISSNPEVKTLSFVSESIIFPHQTKYQTHGILYQIINDLIVHRYRYFHGISTR